MKCVVCGAVHAVCGPRTTVVPVDSNISRREGTMSDLKPYDVAIPSRGGVQRTTLLLSDEDAKAQGLKPAEAKSKTPDNKARRAANKSRASNVKSTSVDSEPVKVSEPGVEKK